MSAGIRWDVRRKLIEVAKKGETITYGELMREFGIPRGHHKPELGIGSIVGEISNYEHSEGRPLISAIVVRADTKTRAYPHGHPGGGFMGLDGIPAQLKRRSEASWQDHKLTAEEQEWLIKEQEKVWAYWKTHD